MMYLIIAEMNLSLLPKDPEEKMKILAPSIEMTKKDLDSGELKMFGQSPDGQIAFAVSVQDPKTIYTKALILAPYAKIKVKPMLSMDELVDAMKKMQT